MIHNVDGKIPFELIYDQPRFWKCLVRKVFEETMGSSLRSREL